MESKILSKRLKQLCKDPLTYLVEAGAHIQQQDIYIEFLEAEATYLQDRLDHTKQRLQAIHISQRGGDWR